MDFTQKKTLNQAARSELAIKNQAYTDCIQKDFLTPFLSGKNVSIEQVCIKEREAMETLDKNLYNQHKF